MCSFLSALPSANPTRCLELARQQAVERHVAQALVAGLVLAQQRLAGEAQRFEQADGGGVVGVHLGDELAFALLGDQVADQRGGAFAGHALALPVGAGDVADLLHPRLVRGHGDEAACDLARVLSGAILGDPGAAVPCRIGEPAPQLRLVGKGGARQVTALRLVGERGQQRRRVAPPQGAQDEAAGVERGYLIHRSRKRRGP